ncbi:fumarylacetoacetate hydrolase family protein [Actinophytocola sp.]|uniref:fumarylacetoacetate hydrolase family protein n=1 Tax=Actinophytocola sp. TaxID=1872138 RepID=UPI003D6B368B
MRFVRFGDSGRTGIVIDGPDGSVVVDVLATVERARVELGSETSAVVGGLLKDGSWRELIGAWDAAGRRHIRELADRAERRLRAGDDRIVARPLVQLRLGPPLPSRRGRVFALGANFSDHASQAFSRMSGHGMTPDAARSEHDRGLPPWGFQVIPDVMIGHDAPVTAPRGVERLDYEAEVAVVLATGGRNLTAGEVSFWGLSAFNDFSIRDGLTEGSGVDRGPLVWALAKNFQTGKSMGPCVAVDAGIDIDDVPFTLAVNDEVRQRASTSQMIYSFTEVATFLSRYLDLLPGDVITSGTPKGTALDSDLPYLAAHDDVRVRIAEVGELRNTIAPW